jgi:hypothetical protein
LHEVSIRCKGDLPTRPKDPNAVAANRILVYRRPASNRGCRPPVVLAQASDRRTFNRRRNIVRPGPGRTTPLSHTCSRWVQR